MQSQYFLVVFYNEHCLTILVSYSYDRGSNFDPKLNLVKAMLSTI